MVLSLISTLFKLLAHAKSSQSSLVSLFIDTIKKNRVTLIDASKEVGLEVNAEKTKYIAVSSLECRAKS
jgi:hypothetical protein